MAGDLHTHSTCSDGSVPIHRLPLMAARLGLSALALSDHDTILSAQYAYDHPVQDGVRLIPAAELTGYDFQRSHRVHILAFWPDPDSPALRRHCDIMRGPVVYCLEEKDNGKNLHELLVDTDMHASVSEGKICDTVVKMVETDGWRLTESGDAEETLYHMYQKPQKQKVRLHYIPYYTWANRGENEMQVWTRVQNP